MSEVHEETWVQGRIDTCAVDCGDGENDRGHFFGPISVAEARARLAASAPEMARAILAVLACQNRKPCASCRMTLRSIIAKAGVPLP